MNLFQFKQNFSILMIFIIGVVLSLLGFWNSNRLEQQTQDASVSMLLEDRQNLLETRIATTVEILDTLGNVIANSEQLAEDSFTSFAYPIVERHSEFWALHWAPLVSHEQRPDFEHYLVQKGRRLGITELEPLTNSQSPSAKRDFYFPVKFTAPLAPNESIIGFDIRSRASTRTLIDQTLNNPLNSASSKPFKLIQDNEGSSSVLLFRPVFNIAPAPSDAARRKRHIRGYVVALIKPQTILDVLSKNDKGIKTQLFDITDAQPIEIGASPQIIAQPDWLTRRLQFDSQGRKWQLHISISTHHPLLEGNQNMAIWVLIAGLGFTFILTLILLRLSHAHRQITQERDRAQNYLDTVETIMVALDKRGRVTMINRKGREILGYDESELLGCFWYKARFMLGSEGFYSRHLQSINEGVLTKENAYTESFIKDKQGDKHLIAWHHRIEFDVNNKPSGILSAGEDITQKFDSRSHDQIRARALQSTFEGLPLEQTLGQLLKDIEAINPGTQCSILRLDQAEQHLLECAAPSLPDGYNRAIHGVAIGEGVGSCGTAAFLQQRVIVEDIQTHPYWADYKGLAATYDLGSCWSEPIFGKKGRLLGTFAIYHDAPSAPRERDLNLIATTSDFVGLLIEENQAEIDLKRMATTDELTALPNRREFFKTLELELQRAKRYSRQLSVCMLDLDYFKAVNDQYGHSAGDCALKKIAEVIESVLRQSDMAGRLGGEEFGILLPDTQEADALAFAERLRQAIADKTIEYQEQQLRITASIGVTSLQLNSKITRASELLSAADRCLYHVKHNGRNQVSNIPTDLHIELIEQ